MKYVNGNIFLTENASFEIIPEENTVTFNGNIFYIGYLTKDFKKSKGGNSSVFLISNKKDIREEYVIKFSKYYKPLRGAKKEHQRRYGRFIEEIGVLYDLREKEKDNIINILDDGVLILNNKEFPYYIMERADTDLKEFIFSNREIDNQEKVKFCIHIYNALFELHAAGYYHRDIKPDNILLFYEDPESRSKVTWKIGDLGIFAHRDIDHDDIGERIGPFGWLSPEAGNKFLTEKAKIGFDCKIDNQSDVFQLGKLFWFIFQGNIPIGQIRNEDFIPELEHKEFIFSVIEEMLAYSKRRRITMESLGSLLDELKMEFAV